MSTDISTKLLTVDEYYEFVLRPENQGHAFELERGRIVPVSRPGGRHGLVCGNVAMILNLYARRRQWGYVFSNDAGIILERDPDTVHGPDVAFFGGEPEYQDVNPKMTEGIPLLAVEVWSPTDRPGKMRRRVARFLQAGVRMVWVIDPEERDVTVWAGGTDVVLDATQEIDGGDVLPDFRTPVAEFFWSPGNKPATGKV